MSKERKSTAKKPTLENVRSARAKSKGEKLIAVYGIELSDDLKEAGKKNPMRVGEEAFVSAEQAAKLIKKGFAAKTKPPKKK